MRGRGEGKEVQRENCKVVVGDRVFVLLWRCAWQFGEVLGGISRLREERRLQDCGKLDEGILGNHFCEEVGAFRSP